jgi:hypothetical protein
MRRSVRQAPSAASTRPPRRTHSRRRYPLREFTGSADTPAMARSADALDLGVHHPLHELLDHLSEQFRARRCQRVFNRSPGTGTMSFTAALFSFDSIRHFEGSRGGRLHSCRPARPGRTSQNRAATPYITPVDAGEDYRPCSFLEGWACQGRSLRGKWLSGTLGVSVAGEFRARCASDEVMALMAPSPSKHRGPSANSR